MTNDQELKLQALGYANGSLSLAKEIYAWLSARVADVEEAPSGVAAALRERPKFEIGQSVMITSDKPGEEGAPVAFGEIYEGPMRSGDGRTIWFVREPTGQWCLWWDESRIAAAPDQTRSAASEQEAQADDTSEAELETNPSPPQPEAEQQDAGEVEPEPEKLSEDGILIADGQVIEAEPAAEILRQDVPPAATVIQDGAGEDFALLHGEPHLIVSDAPADTGEAFSEAHEADPDEEPLNSQAAGMTVDQAAAAEQAVPANAEPAQEQQAQPEPEAQAEPEQPTKRGIFGFKIDPKKALA